MKSILCFVVLHNIVESLISKIYLPFLISYGLNIKEDYISNHKELYFLLKITSWFMLFLYSQQTIYNLLYSKTIDKNSTGLSIIYVKHILDIIITPNMQVIHYEQSRVIMWIFTTPLMLKMLSDENHISLYDLNTHYHILSIVPHIFIVPLKGHAIYIWSTLLLSIPGILFMKTLYKFKNLNFANLYLLIWVVFMTINILETTRVCNTVIIHAFYNIADTIFKFTFSFVISNYNEKEIRFRETIDLQSVNFISNVLTCIKKFEHDNVKLTPICDNLIKYCTKKFADKLPTTNSRLKLELLQKILPLDFDKDYVERNMSTGTLTNKSYTFICVMFMDIVNYTELANKFDSDSIFKLLDSIYHCFDNLIKKYSHLQKIETIGDAYMVVGDIYRQELNHKVVVKEIILLAMEFIKEIKTINTPDNSLLCIRIGITLGTVNVGILGNEIPRLCIVGNTVNMASRLQSTADSDTIQLSRHIYEQADEIDFGKPVEFITKENVFLKNLGSVVTYNICPPPAPH